MKSFKEFSGNRPVFKVIEQIFVKDIGRMSAKIDSGNEAYNVLHGVNISFKDNNITFTTVDNISITCPFDGSINIHTGSGNKEERPVILRDISIGDREFTNVPFSIADRSENTEPILVGEPFLKKINALIDLS